VLTLLFVSVAAAQALNTRETITVGAGVTLGMSEDVAVKKLTEAGYSLWKLEPIDALQERSGINSIWSVGERGHDSPPPFGAMFFSAGRLTSATRDLLPNGSDQVEFGRQLYFAMRDLEAGGDSRCTIETNITDVTQNVAQLHCGKKHLVVFLEKPRSEDESVRLNLEMWSSRIPR
jgi:hypothetical protein